MFANLRQIPQLPALKLKNPQPLFAQKPGSPVEGVGDNMQRSKSGHFNTLLFLFSPAMYSGICICVFLAVLSASSFGQQTVGLQNGNPLAAELEQSLTERHRHIRAPSSAGPLKAVPRLDGSIDQRANIGALLAKYLQQARKGTGYSLLTVLLLCQRDFLRET